MKKAKLLYFLVFLSIFYKVMNYPVKEYMILFLGICFLPVGSRLILMYGSRNPVVNVRFQDKLIMQVSLKQKDCVSRIRVVYRIKNYFTGECYEEDTFHLEKELSDMSCGYLEVSVSKIICYDWFGINKMIYPVDVKCGEYFLPDLRAFEYYQATFSNMGNIRGPKEYVLGDVLQKIHWKLSAKMGKLYTREYEQNDDDFLLLMNFANVDKKRAEKILGMTLYFSQQLLLHKRGHFVGMLSGGCYLKYYVYNEETYHQMVRQILKHPYDREQEVSLSDFGVMAGFIVNGR